MIGIKGIAKKPILDANAKPEDVASGKIFYNNSGKQTGIGTIDAAKTYTVTVSNLGDNQITFNRNTADFYYPNPVTKRLQKMDVTSSDESGGYYAQITLPTMTSLIGIGINGIRYNLSLETTMLICSDKPKYSYIAPRALILISSGNISGTSDYIMAFDFGTFTFYYK